MTTAFASTADTAAKKLSFDEIGPGIYAYTAEGDPNSGVVVGEEGVLVFDAQATPRMAGDLIDRIRQVTEKPITHVVLSHYHAVRTLGASAYHAREIVSSDLTRTLITERGAQDMASEIGRFPRLFRGADTIPGLTWPNRTFDRGLSIFMGKREIRLQHLGRGHTMGDIVAWIVDANVVFAGDLVECGATPYCGDAHFRDWPRTLDRLVDFGARAMVPGRGAALTDPATVREAIAGTKAFLADLYDSVSESVAAGRPLKETFARAKEKLAPRYGAWVIFEHCMPFDVARAYDEARGIDHPVIWTDQRDREMWAALQG